MGVCVKNVCGRCISYATALNKVLVATAGQLQGFFLKGLHSALQNVWAFFLRVLKKKIVGTWKMLLWKLLALQSIDVQQKKQRKNVSNGNTVHGNHCQHEWQKIVLKKKRMPLPTQPSIWGQVKNVCRQAIIVSSTGCISILSEYYVLICWEYYPIFLDLTGKIKVVYNKLI